VVFFSDDTPHVADERLGEAAVLEIVERLTNLIREVFPGKTAISPPQCSLSPKLAWPQEHSSSKTCFPGPRRFPAAISLLPNDL
jgi:hypothetical protein